MGKKSRRMRRDGQREAKFVTRPPEADFDRTGHVVIDTDEPSLEHLKGRFVDDNGNVLRGGPTHASPEQDWLNPPKAPVWAGTFSFKRAWEALWDAFAYTPLIASGKAGEAVAPQAGIGMVGLAALRKAVPLFIGEEQLLALPPLEMALSDAVAEVPLPFPVTYLDFSTARGPAVVPLDGMQESGVRLDVPGACGAYLHGAIVISAEESALSGEKVAADVGARTAEQVLAFTAAHDIREGQLVNGLTIIPLVTVLRDESGYDREADRGDGMAWKDGAALGMVSFYDGGPDKFELFTGVMGGPMVDSHKAAERTPMVYTAARVPLAAVAEDRWLRGHVDCGEPKALRLALEGEAKDETIGADVLGHFMGQAGLLLHCAQMALRSLYLVQAANVVIEDAPLPRQQRREAERRGYEIAKVVRITRSTKQPPRRPGEERREYSHRFTRRAHYKHVTRGAHAKSDFVAPCSRRDPKTGELTCPDGCRREFVPQTVVGDESLPFVPKSYRWPGKDKLMEEEVA